MSDETQLVEQAMKALFGTFDQEQIRALYADDYIQHNPGVPTGREAILGIAPMLEEAGFGYSVHRMVQDGPLVLTHTTYTNAAVFGADTVVAFDLWRVADGKVAEHWDCITPQADQSISGRTQTDGATAVKRGEDTEKNRALVRRFVEEVLIGEDWSNVDEFIRDGVYDQHNPLVGDGPDALQQAVGFLKLKTIHRVVAEGDFVLTQSEGLWDGSRHAFYDLFRVADGRIVEHWDVIQPISDSMAHDNGMF